MLKIPAMTRKLTIYTNPSGLFHDTGPGHPERIARLQTVLTLFDGAIEISEGDISQIARAHDRRYIEKIEASIPDHGYAYADADTALSPGTWQAALTAAGTVCRAVDDVLNGKTQRAFCAVRPPGHHAHPAHAEGFCLFNNIFIGALHAQQTIKRVAILDFDVHHGNGSDVMARAHENIFFASTHQWPLYPGTGLPEDDIPSRVINRTLPADSGAKEFMTAWNEILAALDNFKPDLIMISAGFDAHRDDPLAQINLAENDYAWITGEIVKAAEKHCGGKIVSVLEGGYNLDALKASVAAHLAALV